MGKPNRDQRDRKQSIRPALVLSLIFGVVAGVVTTVASGGGVHGGMNFKIGGIAFLVAFVAGLVVISLLMMVVKENPEEMGRGSGVNRSSQLTDDELRRVENGEHLDRAGERAPRSGAAGATRTDGDGQAPRA